MCQRIISQRYKENSIFPDAKGEPNFFLFFSHEKNQGEEELYIYKLFFSFGGVGVYFGMRRWWLQGAKSKSGVILQVNESGISCPHFAFAFAFD